jgi:hypothetical protein
LAEATAVEQKATEKQKPKAKPRKRNRLGAQRNMSDKNAYQSHQAGR